jgi:excisionase family DNA binding protein
MPKKALPVKGPRPKRGLEIPREYHRPPEAAIALGVSDRTLNEWLARGIVPKIKIGRVVLLDMAKVRAALEKFEYR